MMASSGAGDGLMGQSGALMGLMSKWWEWRKKQTRQTPQEVMEGFAGGGIKNVGKALSMTKAARMARAKEQGFSPTTQYHGSPSNQITEFDPYGRSRYGLFGEGVYLTDNPAIASSYAAKKAGAPATVYPVTSRVKNPINMNAPADLTAWKKAGGDYLPDELPWTGKPTNEKVYREIEETLIQDMIPSYEGGEIMQDILRRMGHDGVIHRGGGRLGSGPRHNVTVAFDPEQVRSIFAKFDPRKISSTDLLAGALPFGMPFSGSLMSGRE